MAKYFKGYFPWLSTLYRSVLSQCGKKWFNLSSIALHNLWKSSRKALFNHEQTMAEKKYKQMHRQMSALNFPYLLLKTLILFNSVPVCMWVLSLIMSKYYEPSRDMHIN